MTTLLFVYGTLRPAHPHPMAVWLQENANCLGAATVQAKLYNLGRYPGIQPSPNVADQVQGDLYDIGDNPATWQELDAYELAESPLPAFFERTISEVDGPDGATPAWVYWYRGDVDPGQEIRGGCYLSWLRFRTSNE